MDDLSIDDKLRIIKEWTSFFDIVVSLNPNGMVRQGRMAFSPGVNFTVTQKWWSTPEEVIAESYDRMTKHIKDIVESIETGL